MADSDRYVLISTDCHAGADLRDYKPYLEQRWHAEFDEWADGYFDLWGDIDTESEWKAGVSSYLSPLNWDSAKTPGSARDRGNRGRGHLPQHDPAVLSQRSPGGSGPRPGTSTTAGGPASRRNNRWLKDFCDLTSGRRLGWHRS